MMASRLIPRSSPARPSSSRSWHGGAFVVEALVVLVFLMTALAIIFQLMGMAQQRATQANVLAHAVVLASNDAESFAANPLPDATSALFTSRDGALVAVSEDAGAAGVGADTSAAGANASAGAGRTTYELLRTVSAQDTAEGTLLHAHITVHSGGKLVYALDTARYVSNAEVGL